MFANRLNRDVVFVVTFILLAQLPAWAAPVEVIPLTGGSWRYNQSNNLDGVMWMDPSYDDTQPLWQEGPALLSNDTGNATINPLIGRIINGPRVAAQGVVQHSYYFRTRFNWNSAPEPGTILSFVTRIDDGAIIFLNGTEILRVFVDPASPVQFASSDLATGFLCGGDADCDGLFSVTLPTGAPLVQGPNVLAAIVYQEGADSSDITFGMRVSVVPPLAPMITDTTQPSNRIVIANRPTTLSMSVTGSPPPTFQWFFEPTSGGGFNPVVDGPGISGATNASLTISNMAATDAGSYFCTAANPAGMINSRTALVQFSSDTSGPVVVRVSGSAMFNRLIVEFDEVVEPGTSQDAFNYCINCAVTPNNNPVSAILGADGKTVTLTTVADLTPNTDYTIDISNVPDLLNQPMVSTQVVVHTWIPTSCGGVLFEAFNAGGGNAVTVLTSHPSFPNNPDFVARLNTMDIRVAMDPANPTFYSGDGREGYGGRLRALFIASESGPHVFYYASDDNGELWLSTDAESTNKVRIARESAWSNTKQWTTSGGGSVLTAGGKRSAPINLQAGKAYYIEALYKEGTGGDNCAVAVQPPSQANPPTDGTGAIPGDQLGATTVPPGIAGPVIISQQPANTILDAPNRATFSVVASASGAPFVCYQWQKAEADGGGVFTEIMGATAPNFTTPSTSVAADNGDMYRVVINAIGGSATSVVATLTVNPDVIRPTVVKVVPTSASDIAVVYSEMMDATATDPFNYAFSGGSGVASAAFDLGNPNRVNLMINPPMTIGNLYTLTMNGPSSGGTLEDTSGNDINPDPTAVTFRAQTFSGNVDTILNLPTTGKLPLGSLTTRGIMVRFVQVSTAIANDIAVAEQMLGGIYPTNAASPLPNIAPLPLHFETGVLNYNKDGPTSMDGSLVPDAQFPGFGNVPLAVLDNLAMEAVCYLELQQGIYRMVVRSDDNFRLTPALSAEDPGNSFVLGEFNNVPGGRGVADSPTNDFIVAEAGLYPMRLVFEQGQGGVAIEWKVLDTETGTYYGVNASLALAAGFPGGGPSAFLPPCSNKALTVKKSGANLTITWPLNGGGNLFQLQQANVLSNPSSSTVWSNVGVVPVTVTGTKTVTVPLSAAANFYRLVRPGAPCSP